MSIKKYGLLHNFYRVKNVDPFMMGNHIKIKLIVELIIENTFII